MMNEVMMKEVASAAQQAVRDIVKRQVAKGAPNQGVSKERHVAIVADLVEEMVVSFPNRSGGSLDDSKWMRLVLRAALSGDVLNASQLRQNLEKEGVLSKESPLANQYRVD